MWFIIAAVAMLIGAPHAMIIRVVVDSTDPYFWVVSRLLISTIVVLPIVLIRTKWRKIVKAKKYILTAGISMSMAIVLYTLAINYSQASYVSILTMLTPIMLILVSAHFFKERITQRKIAGVLLAMIGAFIVVLTPVVLTQPTASLFYPLATVLSIAQSFLFALAFIAMRKANESGVPVLTTVGLTAPIGLMISVPLFLLMGDMSRINFQPDYWLAAGYSAIGVAVIIRAITIAAYKRIGALSIAALTYMENLAAIVLPILIIGEVLSIEMVIGALCILVGIYLIETHRSRHVRHHLLHRHHH